MKYLSLCAGIEAASVAWHHMGWEPVAFSEIESFPSAVLANHYPNTPNWGDMTKYQEWPDANVNVLVGGTPCQSFSVAGLRKGLADPRGNLMLTYLAIADRYRPKWVVWENVPGVLSSNSGRDFGAFLGGLGQLGYGFAYRVLDAQYFGVAQRRRRVFVVGCLGGWQRAAAVLFERHSLHGHLAPSREAGKAAPTIPSRCTAGGGLGADFDCDGGVITMAHGQGGAEIGFDRGPTLTCNHEAPIAAYSATTHTLRGEGFDASEDGTGRGTPLVPVAQPISFHPTQDPISSVNACHAIGTGSKQGCATAAVAQPVAFGGNVARTLQARHDSSFCADRGMDVIATAVQVRRLTPVECERLQGFPDGYTAIPWRGKPADQCPDGPRYKALGNSMAVPVMRWIGERINQVETL